MDQLSRFFKIVFDELYLFCNNYGLAIVLFTIGIKLLLLPFDIRSKVGMRKYTASMKKIQPELDLIKEHYGHDPEVMQKKQMEARKAAGIGLLPKGCFSQLLTLPLMIAFFGVFRLIAYEKTIEMYNNVLAGNPVVLDSFLWVKNIWSPDVAIFDNGIVILREIPIIGSMFFKNISSSVITQGTYLASLFSNNAAVTVDAFKTAMQPVMERYAGISNGLFIMPILVGVLQIFQSKITAKNQIQSDQAKPGTGKWMTYGFPIMFVLFALTSSTALSIYWTVSAILSILTQVIMDFIFKQKDKANKTGG